MNRILQKLHVFWEKQGWLLQERKTLVAVSAGRDSMLLAELFRSMAIPYSIAHVNFKLRGEDSDGDAQFVKEYCKKWGVSYHSVELPTEDNKERNTQLAARELRYKWFAELCEQNGYDYLATAHHLQDSVETQFINLGRGTGLAGMLGVPTSRENIIRPLWVLTPKDRNQLVDQLQLKWREDSSNASQKYLRNKLRHQVLPQLNEIFPSFYDTQLENLLRLKSDKNLIDELVNSYREKIVSTQQDLTIFDLKLIEDHQERSSLLYYLLSDWQYNIHQVEKIWHSYYAENGALFYTKIGKANLRKGKLFVANNLASADINLLVEINTTSIGLPIGTLTLEKVEPPSKFGKDTNTVFLDLEKLKWPLTIKSWQPGDSFQPFGMKGKRQKLQDFFSNNKFSILEKERQLMLWSNEQIIWIFGNRISEIAAITTETTACMKMTWTPIQ